MLSPIPWGAGRGTLDGMDPRDLPLYWKVFLVNGAVFTVGTAVLAFSPARVSERVLASEAAVLTVGLAAMLVVNAALLRLSLAPVDRVIREMDAVRLQDGGARLSPAAGAGGRLVASYNAMLDRIATERATSNAKALAAQEAERHRIAQELHDEVGQSLTAVLLGLKSLESKVPGAIATELATIRETAREGLDDVRRVVGRLRPGVLEDLGLHSALTSLCSDLAALTGAEVIRQFGRVPQLSREQELVVYRVAQEALTNVARHAGARRVAVSFARLGDLVVLEVTDDGQARAALSPGSGIVGMHERAQLIGARLSIDTLPGHGVRVRLEVGWR